MLDHLDDACAVRVIAADPPLDGSVWEGVAGGLAKLFQQFEREGRVTAWGCERAAGGSLVVIAWRSAETLSGCSHDKIGRLLLAHEERGGCRLLNAPPLVVAIDGAARCVDRAGLKALIAAGHVDARTVIYDLAPADLGLWRARPARPLGASPLAGLVAAAKA